MTRALSDTYTAVAPADVPAVLAQINAEMLLEDLPAATVRIERAPNGTAIQVIYEREAQV